MSDHDDRSVLSLIERAGADAPSLHIDAAAVLEGGRRRVRRRRAAFTGMTLAAAASVAAVSLGALGDGFLATQEVAPAEREVVSGDWDSELTFEDGTTFALRPSGDGVLVESAGDSFRLFDSELAGGPVLSTFGAGRPVMLVPNWDPSDPDAVRLGSFELPQAEWAVPDDVARVELADGRRLVVLALGEEAQAQPEHTPAELRPDGTVRVPGPAGTVVALTGEPEEGRHGVTPLLEGQPLPAADDPVVGVSAFDAGDLGTIAVLDATRWDELVPVVRDGSGGVVSRPDLWTDPRAVGPFTVAGLIPPDHELVGVAVRSPESAPAEDGINPWGFIGPETQASVALDGGVATVADGFGYWLLAPAETEVPVAGIVGQDVIAVRTGARNVLVVAAHPASTTAQIVAGGSMSTVGGSETGTDVMLVHASVFLSPGSQVMDEVSGLDTDGNGVADVPVTRVVDLTGSPTE